MTLRDRFAAKLGVSPKRKAEIYLDISRSTTLTDPSYWLQTLFAAGIATLGLVLNSPAVIIGAMLISPLMGPILASGLALATGDLILGLRAALNLLLSCLLAVSFAFLLVTILPFKEFTNEIAARTHPNILDLAVALFSGGIGSIAICKEVKGVVTSIPGVAIAVALMPPLCVVGYGTAIAVGVNADDGMRVAFGGGLLFLTNLVAITFTAMLVFLALHIDAPDVKAQMDEWHLSDAESLRVRTLFSHLPGVPGVRRIGALPGRLLMILIIILVILIPLSRSFNQLKQEVSQQQRENRIRQLVTQRWQKDFGKLVNGEARSYLDHVFIVDQDGKLTLQLRVLTTKPLTFAEKEQFNRALTTSLARPPNTLITQIIEVPTASVGLKQKPNEAQTQAPLTVAQIQSALLERIDGVLTRVELPPPAKLVDYQIVNRPPAGLDIVLTYLSERDIESDGQTVILQQVRRELDYAAASLKLDRIPTALERLSFRRNETSLIIADQQTLDKAAGYLSQHARLQLYITEDMGKTEKEPKVAQDRIVAVKDYLSEHWQIPNDRVVFNQMSDGESAWSVSLRITE